MRIYTTLTKDNIDSIADAMEIQAYNFREHGMRVRGRNKGRYLHEFILRPHISLKWSRGGNGIPGNAGKNRLWAISWAGHYVFMRALLNMDPSAVIKSAMNQFHGFHDFDASAFQTGRRDIGSMVAPQEYQDSQFEEHIEWHDEEDLIRLTKDVLARVDGLVSA